MSTPLQAGDLLEDRYRLIELLGTGGMASVFRADDEQLGRAVAIKLFSPGVVDDARRHESEARTLAGLTGPGLVTLFDARLESDRPYLVMEYVDGEDLAVRLRRGPLSGAEAAGMLAAVGGALAAAHQRGLVHRDVKPANILIPRGDGPGGARLADFGIARLVDAAALTVTGSVMGTAAYVAPEQLRGESAVPASDVYALGLVLVEALTGERVYSGTSVESAMARLVTPTTVPAVLPAPWRRLLTEMTAVDAAARPTIVEAVDAAAALDGAALDGAALDGAPLDGAAREAEAPTPATRVLPTAPATVRLPAAPPARPPVTTRVLAPASAPAPAAAPRRRRPRRRVVAVVLAVLVVGAVAGVAASLLPVMNSVVSSPAPSATSTPQAAAATATTPVQAALASLDSAIAGQEALASARTRLGEAIASGDATAEDAALRSLEDTTADLLRRKTIDSSTARSIDAAIESLRSALGISTASGPGAGDGKGTGTGAESGDAGAGTGEDSGNGAGTGPGGNGPGNGTPGNGDPGKGKP